MSLFWKYYSVSITVFYNIFVFIELLTVVISARKEGCYFWNYTQKLTKTKNLQSYILEPHPE